MQTNRAQHMAQQDAKRYGKRYGCEKESSVFRFAANENEWNYEKNKSRRYLIPSSSYSLFFFRSLVKLKQKRVSCGKIGETKIIWCSKGDVLGVNWDYESCHQWHREGNIDSICEFSAECNSRKLQNKLFKNCSLVS